MDHYFRLPDGNAWSTGRLAYVPADDYLFGVWLSAGLVPDEVATEQEIDGALRTAGLAHLSPLPRRDIPARAWLQRLTAAEIGAAWAAANAAMARGQPDLLALMFHLMSAHEVDVLDQDTIAGVDAMIAVGAIAPARKTAILARGE